jgi:uncharacterized protein YceK
MARAALLLLAIGSPLVSGCGTLFDTVGGPDDDHLYYRGVRKDVAGVKNGMATMALDVPFSAVADTLMAPSIAYHQMAASARTKQNMKADAEMRKQQSTFPAASDE